MFAFLHRLFSRPRSHQGVAPVANHASDRQRSTAPDLPAEAPIFASRSTVVDRAQHIAGYHFRLAAKVFQRLEGKTLSLRQAYDDALVKSLGFADMQALADKRTLFVGLSVESLSNARLEALPPANTVLMLDFDGTAGSGRRSLPEQTLALRSRGFRFGCALRPDAPLDQTIHQFDVVQLATPEYDGIQIAETVRRLRKERSEATPLAVFATGIESPDDFHVCLRANIDYFEGPFVERAGNLTPPRGNVNRALIVNVLNQLRAGAEGKALAFTMSQDPVIAFKLLRYVNSPANGLAVQIDSIEQCLQILGRDRFYRWISLLLFDVQSTRYYERIVTEKALVRAGMMERLGRLADGVDVAPDHLFLTGLFSMLGLLLNQPLSELLADVTMPDAVREALLAESGPIMPFLRLSVALEAHEQDEIAHWSAHFGLNEAVLNRLALDALLWANAVEAANEQSAA